MTDQDTLLEKKEKKEETVKEAPEEKKEPPTTLPAMKTDLLQQYRNMAAISLVLQYILTFSSYF